MKTVRVIAPSYGPNVKAYKELFGHAPSAEDMKWRSDVEREAMAAEAIERGEPIDRWKNRFSRSFGVTTDGWYAKRCAPIKED